MPPSAQRQRVLGSLPRAATELLYVVQLSFSINAEHHTVSDMNQTFCTGSLIFTIKVHQKLECFDRPTLIHRPPPETDWVFLNAKRRPETVSSSRFNFRLHNPQDVARSLSLSPGGLGTTVARHH